jgi:hypothetical protein
VTPDDVRAETRRAGRPLLAVELAARLRLGRRYVQAELDRLERTGCLQPIRTHGYPAPGLDVFYWPHPALGGPYDD